jgi:hypothetical protein
MRQFPQRSVAVDDYLGRLAAALRPLPEADRLSIVAEIESHIAERLASGTPVEAALARLGWPELLARAYLEDHELERALARSSPGLLLSNMLGRATRSIVALAGGFTGLLLYAMGLAFLAIAILKPVAPANVGLWTGPDLFALGVFAATPGRNEILGYWLIPLSLAASLGCYLLAQLLMRSCGRRLLRRPRSAILP